MGAFLKAVAVLLLTKRCLSCRFWMLQSTMRLGRMACTTASSLERLCHGIMASRSTLSAILSMLAVSWRSGVLLVFIGQIFLQALWYCLCTGQHCMRWQDCKNSSFEFGWHWAMNVLMEQQSAWTISECSNATLLDESTSMQHWCEPDRCLVQAVPVALLETEKVHRQTSKVGRLHMVHNCSLLCGREKILLSA